VKFLKCHVATVASARLIRNFTILYLAHLAILLLGSASFVGVKPAWTGLIVKICEIIFYLFMKCPAHNIMETRIPQNELYSTYL
jgi:hypothetical protein